MIPASSVRALLKSLEQDLITTSGEPDYMRYRSSEIIEKRYQAFVDVLKNADEDLSIILEMMEKDSGCRDQSPVYRLKALVDYVQIACAIFEAEVQTIKHSTLH